MKNAMSIEEIEEAKGVITLKSSFGKTSAILTNGSEVEKTVVACPVIGPNGEYLGGGSDGWVRRVDSNNDIIYLDGDKEQLGRKHFIKETETLKITDGKEFNLSNTVDYAHWMVYKHCPYIAEKGRDQLFSSPESTYDFYVSIPELEVNKKVAQHELRAKAYKLVTEDTISNKAKIASLLGYTGAKEASPNEVAEYLLDLADSNPKRIINAYEDKNMVLKLLVLDAIDKDIISNANGLYVYSEERLGTTVDFAVEYLKDHPGVKDNLMFEVYPNTNEEAFIPNKVKEERKAGRPRKTPSQELDDAIKAK